MLGAEKGDEDEGLAIVGQSHERRAQRTKKEINKTDKGPSIFGEFLRYSDVISPESQDSR